MTSVGCDAEGSGLVAREWSVAAQGRQVPGVIWTNARSTGRRPLVLIGHGGSQHKTFENVLAVARLFVLGHGFAAAAIDGPIHGARRAVPLTGLAMQTEFLELWAKDNRVDAMVSDWSAAIDLLSTMPEVDPAAVGWYGVSMGTAYGLPLAAADARIKAALLGMWGTSFPNSGRLAQDAPRVRCPVLFQQKWNDQLFTRESQIELFDRIGSERKWLKVYMGPHATVPEQLEDAAAFLERELVSRKGGWQ